MTVPLQSVVGPSVIGMERRGSTAWLTLMRPDAANALSTNLVKQLAVMVDQIHADPTIRAVVIRGQGKTFCAGADLKERLTMTLDETRAFLRMLNGTLTFLSELPCAVIAAINGAAFGGGLELALACDFRLAAEGVSMGLVETRLGIIPGAGGTQRLPRIVGVAKAKELILTGRKLDAQAAMAIGLVSQVVPAAELEAAAQSLADEIAAGGPQAIAMAKVAIDEGIAGRLDEGLRFEQRCYDVVLTSADRNEGLAAFAEKRAPRFLGK